MPDTLSGGGSSVSCPYDVADQNWEGQNRGGWCRNGRHLCLDVLSGSTDHPTFALMCRLYSDGQSVSPIRIFFYNFSSFFYVYLILIIKIFKPSCLLLTLKKKKKKERSPLCWWLFLQFGWLFFSTLFQSNTRLCQEIRCASEQCFSNLHVIWVIWGSH